MSSEPKICSRPCGTAPLWALLVVAGSCTGGREIDVSVPPSASFDIGSPVPADVFGGDGPTPGPALPYYGEDGLRAYVGARCARCHAAGGAAEPDLSTYILLRRDIEAAIAAADRGHDGNFASYGLGCALSPPGGPNDAAMMLRGWRDGDFPAGAPDGAPAPQSEARERLGTPDDTLPAPAWTPSAVGEARCVVLGRPPAGMGAARAVDVTVTPASAVARVEVFRVEPAWQEEVVARDDDDTGVGFACPDGLGLGPRPLLVAWSLGDPPLEPGRDHALVLRADDLLVARVVAAEQAPAELAVTLALWRDVDERPLAAFEPIVTAPGERAARVPVGEPSVLLAVAGEPGVAELGVDRAASDICVARAIPGPDPAWPVGGALPEAVTLAPGDSLVVGCGEGDERCAAQMLLETPNADARCASAAGCLGTCEAGDLSCELACATTDARCRRCLLGGQLTCRADACANAVRAYVVCQSGCNYRDPGAGSCVLSACRSELEVLDACAGETCDLELAACTGEAP
ncbi:MAG: hypothetical protein H6745_09865 [Deltaproteobacteria bacterium]|nr:hypothetical protein [Deltaproteobacteria bacterium]